MEKKVTTFADVKRSLNRLEGFIDDLLPNIQSLNEHDVKDVWTQLSYWVTEIHNNREGDDSINYIGIHDCVDFILNNKSIGLAKMAFSIETKVKEIESIVMSYISYQITQEVASDFLWETGRILWQIGELYIEPFIQETTQSKIIPDKEGNNNVDDEDDVNDEKYLPEFTMKLKHAFNDDRDEFEKVYNECKGKSPNEIAELIYNNQNIIPDGAIQAIYDTFVKPNMNNENKIGYRQFYNIFREHDTFEGGV